MQANELILEDQWHFFDPRQRQAASYPNIFSAWDETDGEGIVMAWVDDAIDYNGSDLQSSDCPDFSNDILEDVVCIDSLLCHESCARSSGCLYKKAGEREF